MWKATYPDLPTFDLLIRFQELPQNFVHAFFFYCYYCFMILSSILIRSADWTLSRNVMGGAAVPSRADRCVRWQGTSSSGPLAEFALSDQEENGGAAPSPFDIHPGSQQQIIYELFLYSSSTIALITIFQPSHTVSLPQKLFSSIFQSPFFLFSLPLTFLEYF